MSSYSPGRFNQSESSVVEQTFQQRWSLSSARSSLIWAFVNVLLALALYFEISHNVVLGYFDIAHPLLWYFEVTLAVVFIANSVWDILRYLYLGLSLSTSPVVITDAQRKLLAVTNADPGFRSPLPNTPPKSASPGPSYSPSSFNLDPRLNQTPSPNTPYKAPSPRDPSGSFAATSASPSFHASSFLDHSYGLSNSFTKPTSPLTPTSTLSPLFHDPETSYGLRSRGHVSTPLNSPPGQMDDCLKDKKALDSFLHDQEIKEFRSHLDASSNSAPSFWSFNRSFSDYTPVLRKYQYQVACRTPQSAKSTSKDDPDDSVTYGPDEVWTQMGIQMQETDRWVENLRKWLRSTILLRVATEIETINKQLIRIGCEDMEIGVVSISTLKQLAVSKSLQLPSLNLLIPFLEASTNQEYLVHRVKELARGGCMSSFKWNGGGSFKGKDWEEHLPSDAYIVMHLLCSYLDSRLPPHPKFPDGRTFTAQHFMKTPDKPNASKKDYCCLYQSSTNPPHYKVLIADDVMNPRKGRNNMFHAILLFFYRVQLKEHGMLGRVNLGMSGINIDWIFERN